MARCKCGEVMRPWLIDSFFDSFQCDSCYRLMKKIPFGNPDKWFYFFFVLLSLWFTKRHWLEPLKDETETNWVGNEKCQEAELFSEPTNA